MSINDLFYTESCVLAVSVAGKPNEYGIVESTYEFISETPIPCSVTPISTYVSQQKYGIDSDVKLEVAIDYIENCQLATEVIIDEIVYHVKSFTVYPAFMCLPKSITFGLEKL